MVSIFHDQGVGIRNIQARLHDGGAHQHIEFAIPEALHRGFQLFLAHLAVRDHYAGFRNQAANVRGGLLDAANLVMHVEHLAVAQQLAADGRGHVLVLLRTHVRQHRVAVLRRGEDRRHLADPRHRHFQRAGNRGRGHRQHVHVRAQRLDVLLVFHAEALLLVHDDQPQVLPVHARLQQAVGTDHDVHRAVGHAINNLLGLRWGGKARQLLDGGGKVLHALAERVEVLLRQQGGRHQHGHLLAGLHGLECGTHRHLGLAIAHVTDNHAIHRHRLFHVGLHSLDGVVLILGLGEREGIFHLPLPGRIRGEGIARRGLAAGVELHQLARDLTYSTAGLALGVLPIRATHLRQRGLFPADVARQHIQLIHRHV